MKTSLGVVTNTPATDSLNYNENYRQAANLVTVTNMANDYLSHVYIAADRK